ncbi:MAG: hypothetical protein ABIA04_11810 [Pseudomonadota bacterium]
MNSIKGENKIFRVSKILEIYLFLLFIALSLSNIFASVEIYSNEFTNNYLQNENQAYNYLISLCDQYPDEATNLFINLLGGNNVSFNIASEIASRLSQENEQVFIELNTNLEQANIEALEKLYHGMMIFANKEERQQQRNKTSSALKRKYTGRISHSAELETTKDFEEDFKKIAQYDSRQSSISNQDIVLYLDRGGDNLDEKIKKIAHIIAYELIKTDRFSKDKDEIIAQYRSAAFILGEHYKTRTSSVESTILDRYNTNYSFAEKIFKEIFLFNSLVAAKIIEAWTEIDVELKEVQSFVDIVERVYLQGDFHNHIYRNLSQKAQGILIPSRNVSLSVSDEEKERQKLRNEAGLSEETLDSFYSVVRKENENLLSYLSIIPNDIQTKYQSSIDSIRDQFSVIRNSDISKDALKKARKIIKKEMLLLSIVSMVYTWDQNQAYVKYIVENGKLSDLSKHIIKYFNLEMDLAYSLFGDAEMAFHQSDMEKAKLYLELGVTSLGLLQQMIEVETYLDKARKYINTFDEDIVKVYQELEDNRSLLLKTFEGIKAFLARPSEEGSIELQSMLEVAQGAYAQSAGLISASGEAGLYSVFINGWEKIKSNERIKETLIKSAKFAVTTTLMVGLFSIAGPAGQFAGAYIGGTIFGVGSTMATISGVIVALGVESLIFMAGHRVITAVVDLGEDLIRGVENDDFMDHLLPHSLEEAAWEYAGTVVSLGVLKSVNKVAHIAGQSGLIPSKLINHAVFIAGEATGMGLGSVSVQALQFKLSDEPVYVFKDGEIIEAESLEDIGSLENIGKNITGSLPTVISFRIAGALTKPLTSRISGKIHSSQAKAEFELLKSRTVQLRAKLLSETGTKKRIKIEQKINYLEKKTLARIIPHLSRENPESDLCKEAQRLFAEAVAYDHSLALAQLASGEISVAYRGDRHVLDFGGLKISLEGSRQGDFYVFDHLRAPVKVHKAALLKMAESTKRGLLGEMELPTLLLARSEGKDVLIDVAFTPESVLRAETSSQTQGLYIAITAYQRGNMSKAEALQKLRESNPESELSDAQLAQRLETEAISTPDRTYILPRFTQRAQGKANAEQYLITLHNHVNNGTEPSALDRSSVEQGNLGIVSEWNLKNNTLNMRFFEGQGSEPGYEFSARQDLFRRLDVALNSGGSNNGSSRPGEGSSSYSRGHRGNYNGGGSGRMQQPAVSRRAVVELQAVDMSRRQVIRPKVSLSSDSSEIQRQNEIFVINPSGQFVLAWGNAAALSRDAALNEAVDAIIKGSNNGGVPEAIESQMDPGTKISIKASETIPGRYTLRYSAKEYIAFSDLIEISSSESSHRMMESTGSDTVLSIKKSPIPTKVVSIEIQVSGEIATIEGIRAGESLPGHLPSQIMSRLARSKSVTAEEQYIDQKYEQIISKNPSLKGVSKPELKARVRAWMGVAVARGQLPVSERMFTTPSEASPVVRESVFNEIISSRSQGNSAKFMTSAEVNHEIGRIRWDHNKRIYVLDGFHSYEGLKMLLAGRYELETSRSNKELLGLVEFPGGFYGVLIRPAVVQANGEIVRSPIPIAKTIFPASWDSAKIDAAVEALFLYGQKKVDARGDIIIRATVDGVRLKAIVSDKNYSTYTDANGISRNRGRIKSIHIDMSLNRSIIQSPTWN